MLVFRGCISSISLLILNSSPPPPQLARSFSGTPDVSRALAEIAVPRPKKNDDRWPHKGLLLKHGGFEVKLHHYKGNPSQLPIDLLCNFDPSQYGSQKNAGFLKKTNNAFVTTDILQNLYAFKYSLIPRTKMDVYFMNVGWFPRVFWKHVHHPQLRGRKFQSSDNLTTFGVR